MDKRASLLKKEKKICIIQTSEESLNYCTSYVFLKIFK